MSEQGPYAEYNREVRKFTLIAAVMLLAGCARDIQNTEAVRQGVIDYLKARMAQTGLDVNLMQVDITSVSFERDQARANVYFRPKTGDGGGGGGMQMSYVLDRKGAKWVVRGRADSSANPHGTPAGPGGSMETPQLPPIRPPGADQPLPPGHPPVGSKQ
jgi:hypothetical protein